jgi:uncharacterized membrane protein YhiD involved in acid resistance
MNNHIIDYLWGQLPLLAKASINLPFAAILGAALALRPRRPGSPPRDQEVIHTQLLLAAVGALFMMVIGESLARAFGIVGVAGLVRYRAKIEDPKDAGVMLGTLGLGVASGVGLHLLAVCATLFLLLVLWLVESRAPKAQVIYRLKVSTDQPLEMRTKIEGVLLSQKVPFCMRDISDDEIEYEIRIAIDEPAEKVELELGKLLPDHISSFSWQRKKDFA